MPPTPRVRFGSSRKNFSKIRACSACGMPSPSSSMRKRIRLPECLSAIRTRPPSGEYFTALSSRFVSTCRSLSGSAATGGSSSGESTASSTSTGEWARSAPITLSTSSIALQLTMATPICPESRRLAQRMSLTMRASRSASLEITSSNPLRCDSSRRTSLRWSVSAAP